MSSIAGLRSSTLPRPTEPEIFTVPECIARYRILTELGRGAMGRVYLAHDPNIERRIAVKILHIPQGVAPDEVPRLQRRFVLEARAAGRLNHPNIVSIFDSDIDREHQIAFIAMEWVDGSSIEQMLADRGKLSAGPACAVASQVAQALGHAHDLDVIHRDIKPANIMVTRDGRVKVLDFGIAKLASENHTGDRQVLGTPCYMSPEQIHGTRMDGRSDLFSLGTVLFQMLTGNSPFAADTVPAVVHRILNESPMLPPGLVDDTLAQIVARMLAKDPEDRFADGRALVQALSPHCPSTTASQSTLESSLLPDALEDTTDELGKTALRVATGTSTTCPTCSTKTGLPRLADLNTDDERGQDGGAPQLTTSGWGTRKIPYGWLLAATIIAILVALSAIIIFRDEPIPTKPVTLVSTMAAEDTAGLGETTGEPSPVKSDLTLANAAPSPPMVVPSPGRETPAESSTLVIELNSRLKSAIMSVWVDGERAWSRPIATHGNLFARIRGSTIKAEIPIRPGRRSIEVRVTGSKKRFDEANQTTGTFRAGETRYLRANLMPLFNQLDLVWKR